MTISGGSENNLSDGCDREGLRRVRVGGTGFEPVTAGV
jgi:hypothetical protein